VFKVYKVKSGPLALLGLKESKASRVLPDLKEFKVLPDLLVPPVLRE
jgi:hypothetical protein